MIPDSNQDVQPNGAFTNPSCECGDTGWVEDQTYEEADFPDGWVPIQRCDECCVHDSDEDAARAFAFDMFGQTDRYWFNRVRHFGGADHGDWAVDTDERTTT